MSACCAATHTPVSDRLTETGLDVSSVNPVHGNKYSRNLFKYLTSGQNSLVSRYFRVFKDGEGALWIGYADGDYLIGARLLQVLCLGRKAERWAYPHLISKLTEVPDFWKRYQAIGRCAIDPEHQMYFVDDETRWQVDGDYRRCLWCGEAEQKRDIRVETVEHESWVFVGS